MVCCSKKAECLGTSNYFNHLCVVIPFFNCLNIEGRLDEFRLCNYRLLAEFVVFTSGAVS